MRTQRNPPSRSILRVSIRDKASWRAPLLASAATAAAWLAAFPAAAACVFVPTVGDDLFVCDSGASVGGLTDLGGNNTLSLPDAGTGTVSGNVVFGAGRDTIDMRSGTIAGAVDQGAGADLFTISGGTVTGNVQQGLGIDDFRMTGGVIQSLSQGDSLDTFFMSAGRIITFFEDGDRAVMTGGRIGRVDMKLDNNLFDMSGGTIDGNLVTGFGNDTIILSDGLIGGNISVSGGTDRVTVTGGAVGGNVLMSFGADTFTWDGGGKILGAVDLGPDNDTATLRNLDAAGLVSVRVDGGLGVDRLTFNGVATGGIARFQNWETVLATNGTKLTFDGNLHAWRYRHRHRVVDRGCGKHAVGRRRQRIGRGIDRGAAGECRQWRHDRPDEWRGQRSRHLHHRRQLRRPGWQAPVAGRTWRRFLGRRQAGDFPRRGLRDHGNRRAPISADRAPPRCRTASWWSRRRMAARRAAANLVRAEQRGGGRRLRVSAFQGRPRAPARRELVACARRLRAAKPMPAPPPVSVCSDHPCTGPVAADAGRNARHRRDRAALSRRDADLLRDPARRTISRPGIDRHVS